MLQFRECCKFLAILLHGKIEKIMKMVASSISKIYLYITCKKKWEILKIPSLKFLLLCIKNV